MQSAGGIRQVHNLMFQHYVHQQKINSEQLSNYLQHRKENQQKIQEIINKQRKYNQYSEKYSAEQIPQIKKPDNTKKVKQTPHKKPNVQVFLKTLRRDDFDKTRSIYSNTIQRKKQIQEMIQQDNMKKEQLEQLRSQIQEIHQKQTCFDKPIVTPAIRQPGQSPRSQVKASEQAEQHNVEEALTTKDDTNQPLINEQEQEKFDPNSPMMEIINMYYNKIIQEMEQNDQLLNIKLSDVIKVDPNKPGDINKELLKFNEQQRIRGNEHNIELVELYMQYFNALSLQCDNTQIVEYCIHKQISNFKLIQTVDEQGKRIISATKENLQNEINMLRRNKQSQTQIQKLQDRLDAINDIGDDFETFVKRMAPE